MINLTKIIASLLIAVSLMALNPIGASAEWKQDSKGWWYAQGNSYYKNQWKQINGKWYYFDYDGYMAENKIIDGYYLDSNGTWSTGTKEIQAYGNILTNPKLLKEKYGLSISYYAIKNNISSRAEIFDIDKDGIYEAVVHNETCHADAKTSVFTYKNGDIKFAGDLENNAYYSEKQNVLLGSHNSMGGTIGGVYKLENGIINKIHSFKITFTSVKSLERSYEMDGEYVTKEQLNDFFKQYGATFWVIE